MRRQVSRIQQLAILLAVSSMLATPVLVSASPATRTVKPTDVALAADGTLGGIVVNSQGKRRAGAIVELHRGRQLLARVQSDASGRYTLPPLQGGLYQLTVDGVQRLVRAWAAGTAPRQATSTLQVVADAPVVRGQDEAPPTGEVAAEAGVKKSGGFLGMGEMTFTKGLLIAGGVVGAVFIIDELDDDDDDDDPQASP